MRNGNYFRRQYFCTMAEFKTNSADPLSFKHQQEREGFPVPKKGFPVPKFNSHFSLIPSGQRHRQGDTGTTPP